MRSRLRLRSYSEQLSYLSKRKSYLDWYIRQTDKCGGYRPSIVRQSLNKCWVDRHVCVHNGNGSALWVERESFNGICRLRMLCTIYVAATME